MIMQLEVPHIQFIADVVEIPARNRDRSRLLGLWRRCFDGRGTGFFGGIDAFFRAPPGCPGVERPLQFFDRVVVLAVILQRQVVDIPVMAQLQDLLVCLPLRLSSCSTLTVSSMSLLRRSSRFVRCRGKQSRSHSCSSFLLDKLLLARCVQRQVPMSITLQFIDSCERPCDHTATVVQWQSLRFSSSPESWTDQLCNRAWYLTFSKGGLWREWGFFDAFCVVFRAPPAVLELSASFSSFRALTTVSARGLQLPCQLVLGCRGHTRI